MHLSVPALAFVGFLGGLWGDVAHDCLAGRSASSPASAKQRRFPGLRRAPGLSNYCCIPNLPSRLLKYAAAKLSKRST